MAKKNSKKTVPDLRFRGFTDPWEQRQLGEVALFSKGQGYSKADLRPSGSPAFLYGQMYTDYRLSITDSNQYLPQGSKGIFSTSGDVIVPASGESAQEIAIASVVEKAGILLGGDLNIIKPNETILDSTFLALNASGGKLHNNLAARAQGKTIVHLHNPDIASSPIKFPTIPEQRLIGEFFSTLDSLIAAAERQEDLLKQKKQAYLQLMFPQGGENEPRLRFAGFSGEWEQRRFGEIFQYERPDAYLAGDDEIEDEGAIPVLTANKAFILGYTNSFQGIYQKGRCIIFDDFTLDSKRVEHPFKVRSSAIKILTVRENMDFDFAFELLRTSKFPLLGHARHYITVVQPQAALIPHSLQEQQHIGRFFRNFDSLIAAAEKRAASLRALKSAYLQRMFV